MESLIELLKQSYSKALSADSIRNFATRLKKMHVGYWVDFEAQGESRSYFWVAIRSGKNGRIMKIREFRDKRLKQSFSSVIEKLQDEKQTQEEQLRRQQPQQISLFG